MPTKKSNRPAPTVTVTALQDSLVELIDLALQAKQYHWTVTGPQFRPVHLQLDEITDSVRLWYDEVAERLAALDVPPDGRASTVVAKTPLADPGPGWQPDVGVIEAMGARLDRIAGSLRKRALAIGEADLISQGMLLEIGAGLEKQAWMLRVQAR